MPVISLSDDSTADVAQAPLDTKKTAGGLDKPPEVSTLKTILREIKNCVALFLGLFVASASVKIAIQYHLYTVHQEVQKAVQQSEQLTLHQIRELTKVQIGSIERRWKDSLAKEGIGDPDRFSDERLRYALHGLRTELSDIKAACQGRMHDPELQVLLEQCQKLLDDAHRELNTI